MDGQVAQHVIGVPSPRVRPFVHHYTGYRYEGFASGVHPGLPSRHLTLIITLGAAIEVGQLDDLAAPRERFAALAGGLHVTPAAVHHDGNQYGVQLAVTPLGARALFRMPPAEIASLTLPLDAVLGRLAGELVERVRAAPVWSLRFAVLDDVLGRAASELERPQPEVAFAWDRLTRSRGAVAIGHLATEVGWSRRHLSERFRREFGLTPKTVARVVRFEHSRGLLAREDRLTLGAVAVAAGYADQAHMNRDWRELAGTSPGAWLDTELLPLANDDGAGADLTF
jgi:AraC-like DNA-binding protein